MQQPHQPWGPAPNDGQFEGLAAQLMNKVVDGMEEEHQREMSYIRGNKQMLQKELRRMVLLMQQELLPRERQLHEMLENLNVAYRNANHHLQSSVVEVNRGASASSAAAGGSPRIERRPTASFGSQPQPSPYLFDAMDQNHDGIISREEFQQAMQSPVVRSSMFSAVDRNNDGIISRQEMGQALGGSSSLAQTQMPVVGAPRPIYGAAGRSQEDWRC